jgi:adenosine deaminase/adenosine deaminase CECR1
MIDPGSTLLHYGRTAVGTSVAFALLVGIVAGCASVVPAPDARALQVAHETDNIDRTAAWFDAHRNQPPSLRAFLQRMPKGGDIHSHLGGAVYAESYIGWAAEAGYCVDESDDALRLLSCPEDSTMSRLADRLDDSGFYNRLIDQMSIRNLDLSGRSGHDQFFAAFRTFGPVSRLRIGEAVAEVATRAANQRTYYLELMVSVQNFAVRKLGHRLDPGSDHASMHRQLLDPEAGLGELLAAGRGELDRLEQELQQAMNCGGPTAAPGCEVKIRYLQTSSRHVSPAEVFAQLTFAVELARTDPRVVGINFVAPEDSRVALRDYTAHMQMLDFLISAAPEVNVSLHAGELTLGLVPPEDLRFHIREAVETGHARRIGHGVDIAYEDGAPELLAEMRERGVLVEICLTSNDVILDVRGNEHPLPIYLEAGVPVTLATDDEGLSRIDLTNEYLRAALTYDLGYRELKTMARNSLEHSFLPGASLWQPGTFEVTEACTHDSTGATNPSPICSQFLESSERAHAQWRLEAELATFETLTWLP